MTTKVFKTRDMGLAAALILLDYKYLGIEWISTFGLFQFEYTDDIMEKEQLYLREKMTVNAKLFALALHTLKREVTSHIKTNDR